MHEPDRKMLLQQLLFGHREHKQGGSRYETFLGQAVADLQRGLAAYFNV